MLDSVATIASELSSSSARENVWPSRTNTRSSICSLGRIVSPVTSTPEIV